MKFIKKWVLHFYSDSLYRNSFWLMAGNFLMAGVGFIYWMICTKIFSPEQIGIATALLSSVGLISSISLIGLNTSLIRYLPQSIRKVDKINTVITVITLVASLFAIVYLVGLGYFSPKLLFIRGNLVYILLFVLIVIFQALSSVFYSTFVAYRNTKYVFYYNLIGSTLKIGSMLLLVTLGSFAIFLSSSAAAIATFITSLFILYNKYAHKFRFSIQKDILKKMSKMSFANYISTITASLPLSLLPVLIVNNLGSKQAAFYYMDMAIVSLLNTIQSSIGQSLFAEGSNNEEDLKKYVVKSVKSILIILIPSIFCILIFGKYILQLFGKDYSNEGVELLYLLSLSVIFTSINGMITSILYVKGKVAYVLAMCIIGPVILLTFVHFAIPYGLVSLGYAWLFGEGLIALIYIFVVLLKKL